MLQEKLNIRSTKGHTATMMLETLETDNNCLQFSPK